MTSPFDWQGKPSTLVNDRKFNGVNNDKARRATKAAPTPITIGRRFHVYSRVRPNEGRENG